MDKACGQAQLLQSLLVGELNPESQGYDTSSAGSVGLPFPEGPLELGTRASPFVELIRLA